MSEHYIIEDHVYRDNAGRTVLRREPVIGIPDPDFREYLGTDTVEIDGGRYEINFPIPVRTSKSLPFKKSLRRAFEIFDRVADEAKRVTKERAEAEKQAQEAAANKLILPTAPHDPTLQERHLDEDGNEIKGIILR